VKHTDPKAFAAINRAVRSIIPSIERIDADLDDQRGIIDIFVKQDGIEYPSRIVSEGTLRVLALCCIVLNPWPGTLVAFEEPENGVHPRRLELIARLLFSLSVERGQQVIVTTHSPLFAEQVLRLQRERSQRDARLLIVGRRGLNTVWHPFESSTLFSDEELQDAISSRREDGLFEGLVLRGLVDA
jgi:predicted ATPase